ncbi:MAG: ferritin-like domain-containing protein, partial [Cyclobacteriaceae bacterium]
FSNAFTNYMTFLTLSQAFEDTGVRAYKGQAGNLLNDNDTLKAALQIHSVEARHASEVRRLRGTVISQSIKGWISGNEPNGAPASVYAGEENVTHAGASLNSITSISSLSSNAKTEAFDEPLTKEQVLAIVQPFLA